MWSVSFRVAVLALGTVQTVNGSFLSSSPYTKGEMVKITSRLYPGKLINAEVIESVVTTRTLDTYKWIGYNA